MDYEFRLPAGKTFLVKGWGNLPIELLAALSRVKPVIHCWVEEEDRGYLENLCSAFGLRYLVYSQASHGQGPPRLGVMLGEEQARLKEAAAAWDRPRSNPGELLGYPPCCTRAYWSNNYQADSGRDDVLLDVYRNTSEPRRLPFLLNNAFYLFSRPWGNGDAQRREEICRRNPGLDMNSMNVIPWHPCSFRCQESLGKAQAIWRTMLAVLPGLSAVLKACLSKPVLFWDWSRFAVLKGSCEKERNCSYSGIQPPFSLLEPGILELLKAGNRLVKERGWEVWRDSKRLGALPGKPVLLEFTPEWEPGPSSRKSSASGHPEARGPHERQDPSLLTGEPG